MDIERNKLLIKIEEEYEVHQICALLGPRQCGKTTLAKAYMRQFQDQVHFFDCENPTCHPPSKEKRFFGCFWIKCFCVNIFLINDDEIHVLNQ